MGNKKEYYSDTYGIVYYDTDVLDESDVIEMDYYCSPRGVQKTGSYNNNYIDIETKRLQRVIDHAERVSSCYDPGNYLDNIGIDPCEKPHRYLNTLSNRLGWRIVNYKISNILHRVIYCPPNDIVEPVVIYYGREDMDNYSFYKTYIEEFHSKVKMLNESSSICSKEFALL